MSRVSDEVEKIMAQLQAISCEVCQKAMGYVEDERALAAYCSDKCVKTQAKRNTE